MLAAENPGITLIPNFPSGKQSECSHGLAVWDWTFREQRPPRFDVEIRPLGGLNGMEAQPRLYHPPKSNGVAAMHEEMGGGLRCLFA